jgi:hypothetical protein
VPHLYSCSTTTTLDREDEKEIKKGKEGVLLGDRPHFKVGKSWSKCQTCPSTYCYKTRIKECVVDIHKEEYETHELLKKTKNKFFRADVEKLSKPNSLFTN